MAERKPRTASEAGGLADDYIQARKQTKEEKQAAEASDRKPTSGNGFRRYESGGQFGQSTRDFRKTSLPKEGQSSTRPANQGGPNTGAGGQGPRRDYGQVRCYNCSQWGGMQQTNAQTEHCTVGLVDFRKVDHRNLMLWNPGLPEGEW